MSFESINEEIDATTSDRDVGVFLPDQVLLDWFDKMKKKMPRAFSPDDTLFGDDAGQHRYGTKLKTFFDDDPEKPIECYVLGSKWQLEDCRYPGIPTTFADGREPVYAVLMNGQPTQINFMDAHEGEYGWRVVESRKKLKKESGTILNERLDMLARLNSSHHTNDESDDRVDDCNINSLELQNARIQRALKTMHLAQELVTWGGNDYSKFLDEFLDNCFTPEECAHIMMYTSGDDSTASFEDKIKSFPAGEDVQDGNNFYARIAIAKMAIYHTKENLGGVILANKRGTKFQAIEFCGFCASQGIPCISIQYGVDPEGIDRTEDFLRGETYEAMIEENSIAVSLEEHFLDCIKNEGTNDLGSGLLFYQGHLAPMRVLPLHFHQNAKSEDLVQPADIPDVNFGVELEMSCASGNQTDRVASNLARNANIEVKVREFGGAKGKGGFWPRFGKGKSYIDSDDSGRDNDDNSVCSSHESMPDHYPTPQLPTKTNTGHPSPAAHEENNIKIAKNTKWSICYDKSIKPNEDNPMSTMLELVSPILTGQAGLNDLEHTYTVISDIVCMRLNASMGLHVHVETKESEYSLESMISICQQFAIYEEVIDKFLHQSRRSGSDQSHSYFQSNKLAIMSSCNTFVGALARLASCESRKELYRVMNPGDRARYHKLNLQNLKTGRQPTIEFRQHHATRNLKEVKAWVRFCILFTTNAAKMDPVPDEVQPTFESLFTDIIRCPMLRSYYEAKREVVSSWYV